MNPLGGSAALRPDANEVTEAEHARLYRGLSLGLRLYPELQAAIRYRLPLRRHHRYRHTRSRRAPPHRLTE